MKKSKPAIRFEKRIYRAFLVTTMLALMPASILPAAAQDEEALRWFGGSYDNMVTLAYGIPDSDYVSVSFSCAIGKAVVNVEVQDEESRAEEGTPLLVRLSAGRDKIEFTQKAHANQDSGGADVTGHLPLNDTLRRILTAQAALEIVVDGHIQRYDMDGAAGPVATMLAACDAPRPASDLDVTVTNKAKRPLQSLAYSEVGLNSFNSDPFGYELLAPGANREFTIPGGRDICTFDLSVTFVEEDEECCSMGEPAGTQDLCENSEFIVHD